LRDRMAAGVWRADRAFGKAVQVVEIPEDPQQEQVQEVRQELRAMPVELREAVGRWLLERRNSRLRAQREEIEAKVWALMPAQSPDGDDAGPP